MYTLSCLRTSAHTLSTPPPPPNTHTLHPPPVWFTLAMWMTVTIETLSSAYGETVLDCLFLHVSCCRPFGFIARDWLKWLQSCHNVRNTRSASSRCLINRSTTLSSLRMYYWPTSDSKREIVWENLFLHFGVPHSAQNCSCIALSTFMWDAEKVHYSIGVQVIQRLVFFTAFCV